MRLGASILASFIAFASACSDESQLCPPDVSCNAGGAINAGLAVELSPTAKATGVAQDFPLLSFDDKGRASVRFGAAVTLHGVVKDAMGNGAPAQIVASRPSSVPGRPEVSFQTSTAGDGSYSVALSSGTYSVRVVPQAPDDANYPPVTRRVTLMTDQALDVQLPALSSPTAGRVVDAIGAPIAGARVTAIDPASGVLSSSVATTAADGTFALFLSPDAASGSTLVVTADAGDALPLLSTAITVGSYPGLVLQMPALPKAVAYQLDVDGKSPSGADTPLAGVTLRLSVDVTAVDSDGKKSATTAIHTVTAITDSDGAATVMLIPGVGDHNRTYDVRVTPPADSSFGSKELTRDVDPFGKGGNLGTLELDARPQLVGRIVGPSMNPVASAVVAPQVSSGAGASTALPTAVTDSSGGFAVRLDPGTYDLDVVPPAVAPLARWSIERSFSGDVNLGDVVLPRAVMAQLYVVDDAGKPVGDIEARVYAVGYTRTGCAPGSTGDNGLCPLPPLLRADAVSDDKGIVTLLLPQAQ